MVFFRMGCVQSWGTVLGFIAYVLDTSLLFRTLSHNTAVPILCFFWSCKGTMQLSLTFSALLHWLPQMLLFLGMKPYCCSWMVTSDLSLAFTTLLRLHCMAHITPLQVSQLSGCPTRHQHNCYSYLSPWSQQMYFSSYLGAKSSPNSFLKRTMSDVAIIVLGFNSSTLLTYTHLKRYGFILLCQIMERILLSLTKHTPEYVGHENVCSLKLKMLKFAF